MRDVALIQTAAGGQGIGTFVSTHFSYSEAEGAAEDFKKAMLRCGVKPIPRTEVVTLKTKRSLEPGDEIFISDLY